MFGEGKKDVAKTVILRMDTFLDLTFQKRQTFGLHFPIRLHYVLVVSKHYKVISMLCIITAFSYREVHRPELSLGLICFVLCGVATKAAFTVIPFKQFVHFKYTCSTTLPVAYRAEVVLIGLVWTSIYDQRRFLVLSGGHRYSCARTKLIEKLSLDRKS